MEQGRKEKDKKVTGMKGAGRKEEGKKEAGKKDGKMKKEERVAVRTEEGETRWRGKGLVTFGQAEMP